jgi:hypothetical protein
LLWISGIKIGEEFRVGEIVEMEGVIAHDVFKSGNEVVAWDVTMMALMESLGSKEVGRGSGRGSRSLALPKKGGAYRMSKHCGAAL